MIDDTQNAAAEQAEARRRLEALDRQSARLEPAKQADAAAAAKAVATGRSDVLLDRQLSDAKPTGDLAKPTPTTRLGDALRGMANWTDADRKALQDQVARATDVMSDPSKGDQLLDDAALGPDTRLRVQALERQAADLRRMADDADREAFGQQAGGGAGGDACLAGESVDEWSVARNPDSELDIHGFDDPLSHASTEVDPAGVPDNLPTYLLARSPIAPHPGPDGVSTAFPSVTYMTAEKLMEWLVAMLAYIPAAVPAGGPSVLYNDGAGNVSWVKLRPVNLVSCVDIVGGEAVILRHVGMMVIDPGTQDAAWKDGITGAWV